MTIPVSPTLICELQRERRNDFLSESNRFGASDPRHFNFYRLARGAGDRARAGRGRAPDG